LNMMNIATLMARHDPHYALRTQELETKTRAQYEIAQFNANSAITRENIRGDNAREVQHIRSRSELERQHVSDSAAFERDRFKAEKEDERHDKTIKTQVELEKMRGSGAIEVQKMRTSGALEVEDVRGKNALSVEEFRHQSASHVEHQRGQNSLTLAQVEHLNLLERMETDLRYSITRAGTESAVLATHKVIDEDNKRRASLLDHIQARGQLRGKVQEMLIGAVIQEKLAQKQHVRDIEKLEKESSLRRFEAYWNSFTALISSLYESGKRDEARAEIDRQIEKWQTQS
jgi:hypothetical protein